MLDEICCSIIDFWSNFFKMFHITFRIERIRWNLKRYAVFSADLLWDTPGVRPQCGQLFVNLRTEWPTSRTGKWRYFRIHVCGDVLWDSEMVYGLKQIARKMIPSEKWAHFHKASWKALKNDHMYEWIRMMLSCFWSAFFPLLYFSFAEMIYLA